MLVQLIYTSRLIFDASTPDGWSRVNDIAAGARRRNTRSAVTGYLIVGQDWVAQVLEGPRDAVMQTFMRILADTRHTNIVLVDIRIIAARMFKDWSLGISPRAHAAMPFNGRLSAPGVLSPITFDVILTMAQVEAA